MEQRAHDCAAVGGGVIHQRVEVGQQRVADVQHIPGDILKRGVPRHGVLPLKRENSVISFGRKEKILKICSFFPIFVVDVGMPVYLKLNASNYSVNTSLYVLNMYQWYFSF